MDAGAGLLLPEGTRLIHIGPHKTGSTAIQVALHQAREELAAHGVHYAGQQRRPRLAGWAIGLPGKRFGTPTPPIRHWEDLVRDVRAAGEVRVCVSNEDFARGGPEQRRRIVEELGGGRPHVVAVARRLDTYLPSQWQERVKAGMTLSWEEWLRIVLDRDNPEHHFERVNVWRAHDVGGMLGRWAEVVPAERMTLIVSDDVDRDLLPRTFERLLGLPAGLLRPEPDQSNRSLSWSETESVLAAHRTFAAAGVSRRDRDPWMARGVVEALRTTPRSRTGPSTPPFPSWAADQLRELGQERAEAVRRTSVRVVGSAEALLTPEDLSVADAPQPPPLDQATVQAITDALIRATVRELPALATETGAG